ncbi:hypothetical protein PIB30_049175 [Stylosanthes scabra]|uniref:Uncharacterized protein n=1 Tax=Stylosanthes scabra TaxID=79078 RepID=A0ABU6SHY2_9FABA|nr:hypothetical protein [Stylosanthes scabra]
MVERYLCLMLSGKIHGIELSKLLPNEDEDEDEGYRQPPPPPLPPLSSFDFTIDLPARDMQVFFMDSKIYLVGGSNEDDDYYEPCYEIYEFQCDMAAGGGGGDGEGKGYDDKKLRLNLLESIPKVPVHIDFHNSYIACVSNEAYFLACDDDEEYSFWVLRGCGSGREWECLPLNTLLETQGSLGYTFISQRPKWFYSDNMLFLHCWEESESNPEQILCCFDQQTRQWTMEEIYRGEFMKLWNII